MSTVAPRPLVLDRARVVDPSRGIDGPGAVVVIGGVTYGLDLQGALALNIANVFGTGLGTLFRFWSYRRFVFTGTNRPPAEDPATGVPDAR